MGVPNGISREELEQLLNALNVYKRAYRTVFKREADIKTIYVPLPSQLSIIATITNKAIQSKSFNGVQWFELEYAGYTFTTFGGGCN